MCIMTFKIVFKKVLSYKRISFFSCLIELFSFFLFSLLIFLLIFYFCYFCSFVHYSAHNCTWMLYVCVWNGKWVSNNDSALKIAAGIPKPTQLSKNKNDDKIMFGQTVRNFSLNVLWLCWSSVYSKTKTIFLLLVSTVNLLVLHEICNQKNTLKN